MRSLHIYVAVFERNHICVAESLENMAVCRFAPTANEYNQQLRKLSTLKLQLDSFASRVTRCEARAELRREALTKLKKTPGLFRPPSSASHACAQCENGSCVRACGSCVGKISACAYNAIDPVQRYFPHPRAGIRKIALKDTEDKLEHARNEVANAKAAHARQIEMVKLREDKVATAKGTCEECLALVEEACAIGPVTEPGPLFCTCMHVLVC